jgi:2-phosphoglycerate kinase
MGGHTLYLVGGAPRVGKSSLAQRLLETDGIPWLPTDVLRTVLRRVLPELDAIDQDLVDARQLANSCIRMSSRRPRCAPMRPSGS